MRSRYTTCRLVVALSLAWPVAGHPAPAPPAWYDESVDFEAYRSFALAPDAILPQDPLAATLSRAAEAVGRALEAAGLQRAAARPGLVASVTPGGSLPSADALRHSGGPAPAIDVRDVDPASIVVDLVDARTGRLVWRGVADAVLVSPSTLDETLQRLLRAHYPARAAFYKKRS